MESQSEFAYILACGDPKIRAALQQIFDERFGPENYFWCPELGGVKNLVLPERVSDTEYVIRKMKTAALVHPFSHIIFVNHSDCGAYRLAGHAFADARSEEEYHCGQLGKAVAKIKKAFPNAVVETHYFLKAEQKMAW